MLYLLLFDFELLEEVNSRFSVGELVVVGWVFVVE
jgi:hypothetical protein